MYILTLKSVRNVMYYLISYAFGLFLASYIVSQIIYGNIHAFSHIYTSCYFMLFVAAATMLNIPLGRKARAALRNDEELKMESIVVNFVYGFLSGINLSVATISILMARQQMLVMIVYFVLLIINILV